MTILRECTAVVFPERPTIYTVSCYAKFADTKTMAGIDKERWLRISPLLDELLEADECTRITRIERVRRDDAALADELLALLGQYASLETAEFLEDPRLYGRSRTRSVH